MRNTCYIIKLVITGYCLLLASSVKAQSITISITNAPLEEAFNLIKKQSDYNFIYTRVQMGAAKPVTIQVQGQPIAKVLYLCFKDQPLTYVIEDKQIVVKEKRTEVKPVLTGLYDLTGRIKDETGNPIPSVTVSIKRTGQAKPTNDVGRFVITDVLADDILRFTSIGYEPEEVQLNGRPEVNVTMRVSVTNLDQAVVIAYGVTTPRLSTGSVAKISAKEIASQPVSNPLAALQGRVPGLLVTQSSGVPGAAFKVQIRGQNSIAAGNNPLFIIDGVPFAPGNNTLSQLISAAGVPATSDPTLGISPFNIISPADIESIEVLKDADATAIYGSRGANGVILITTKKGQTGNLRVAVNLNSGWSTVTRTMDMLNTQQYVQMRREALANDGLTPNPTNAYDFLLWDTTRYTDLKKLLIGNTAKMQDAQVTISGGILNTLFSLGMGYYHETTVYPSAMGDRKISFHSNLNHKSNNEKFSLIFTTNYSSDKNSIASGDLTSNINLPPNLPALYDDAGKLNWTDKGVTFVNPLAYLLRTYQIQTDYLLGNLQLSYKISPSFTLRNSVGYNTVSADEISIRPKASVEPQSASTGSANFATTSFRSWIIEPQIEYNRSIKKLRLSFLFGGTLQNLSRNSSSITANGYTNDALLGSLDGATEIFTSSTNSQYKYAALFGRITSNWNDKYILNLSGRRDGSSRFGPGKQWANFGAIGAAWIFSGEKWIGENIRFLSFGKLRGSIGLTGNDQIGDYQYLNNWVTNSNPYNGSVGLNPVRLYNPNYAWETNKKIEATIETGFFKNRLYVTATYYRNQSSNQLLNYTLPVQTGFTSVLRNRDAVVRNTGVELYIKGQIITTKNFKWISSVNATVPKNVLVSFPDLAKSSYATVYREGYSLSLLRLYQYEGVDQLTGVYSFTDQDKNGVFNQADRIVAGNLDPKYYGGFNQSLTYKQWNVEIFCEFRNQKGRNYLGSQLAEFTPGILGVNQPVLVLNRWQQPGQQAAIQRYTTGPGSAAYTASATRLLSSTAIYSNASFIRLKNVALSYNLPSALIKKWKLQNLNLFLRCQNLLTITRYVGSDPERQNLYVLPPLRTINTGIQITL